MTWFSVDIEADGPIPGPYSMLSIGVVAVRDPLVDRFYRELAPISERWQPDALAVSGLDRDRLVTEGSSPREAVAELRAFLDATSVGPPVFVSDNPGFDAAFVSHYCHRFDPAGNPFGHSARRIGDLWAGHLGDAEDDSGWRSFVVTEHTHNALDDAVGNAEAMLAMVARGLTIPLD
ncbi:MAG: exonuclease [Actinomycetota bacterium]